MSKTPIQLSDHFTCRKLICFTLPSITMIIFTAIYGVVDGFFVSNYAGKTPFAAVNLIIPVLFVKVGNAPLKKFKVIERKRSDEAR